MTSTDEKIKGGIMVLDYYSPDWHWRVNLHTLHMRHSDFYLLAQLFGSFEKGRKKLNMDDNQAYELGFASFWQFYFTRLPFLANRLTKKWIKAIKAKRAAEEFSYSFDLPNYNYNKT